MRYSQMSPILYDVVRTFFIGSFGRSSWALLLYIRFLHSCKYQKWHNYVIQPYFFHILTSIPILHFSPFLLYPITNNICDFFFSFLTLFPLKVYTFQWVLKRIIFSYLNVFAYTYVFFLCWITICQYQISMDLID